MTKPTNGGRHLSRSGKPLVTPRGMGDLLPPEASERRQMAAAIQESFRSHGYELVIPPMFEHEEVVERGNEVDSRDLLRFVEPDSGEVAVLRPDITPQIARIVATRMQSLPAPWRLCYEGRVIRRRRQRARNHQQVTQAGVECIGLPGRQGDREVLALAYHCLRAAGLEQFRLELTEATLIHSVMAQVPPALRPKVSELLGQKDAAALAAVTGQREIPKQVGKRLHMLLECYGDLDELRRAARRFRWEEARVALANLTAVTNDLLDQGMLAHLGIDLGESRGVSYYTGVNFTILAEGPGEAIGGGGRYDRLLSKFGKPATATGFAINLGNLQWALREQGSQGLYPEGFKVAVGGSDQFAAEQVASALRDQDCVAATLSKASARQCLAYASSRGYHMVVMASESSMRATRCSDGAKRSYKSRDLETFEALVQWAQGRQG